MSNFDRGSIGYTSVTVGLSAVVSLALEGHQIEVWVQKQTAGASLYMAGSSLAIGTGFGVNDSVLELKDYRGDLFLSSVGATCSVDVFKFFTHGA